MIETTSLELSKKLDKFLRTETEKEWYFLNGRASVLSEVEADSLRQFSRVIAMRTPAYTACELMKVLPASIIDDQVYHYLFIGKVDDKTCISYDDADGYELNAERIIADNPAEALGEMVLWLDKEGLLK